MRIIKKEKKILDSISRDKKISEYNILAYLANGASMEMLR